jgi:predicted tellurium resistance membrane protein TerC
MMYVASGLVTAFIAEHPTTKMLALASCCSSASLLAEDFDFHIPRDYIYFATGIKLAVNLRKTDDPYQINGCCGVDKVCRFSSLTAS